jgi:hypothetical protein
VVPRLAALAVRARLGTVKDNEQVLAQRFLDAVDALNRDLGIPTHLAALREKDIPALAEAALHEAHTGYPVPRYMTRAECESLIRRLLPPKEEAAAPTEGPAAPAASDPAATPAPEGQPKAARAPRKAPAPPTAQTAQTAPTPRAPRKSSSRKTPTAE